MENYDKNFSKIIFITGGTKSGKSEFAEYLARKIKKVTYVALSEPRINDINWQKKISDHRRRRPKNWDLIETNNLICALKSEDGPLLIDSIGGFIMENINKNNEDWLKKISFLIDLLMQRLSTTIIVGEQVGWSLVSEYEIGNKYIERLGDLQQRITRISSENWLTLNGRAIKLDNISFEIPS